MKTRFYNSKVLFIWAVGFTWILGVTAGTLVVFRDGLPENEPRGMAVLFGLIFWLFAAWLTRWLLRQPLQIVSVLPGGKVEAVLRYPLHTERCLFSRAEVLPLQLIESEDQDGDPYYELQLPILMKHSKKIILAEGSREHCQSTEKKFNEALSVFC